MSNSYVAHVIVVEDNSTIVVGEGDTGLEKSEYNKNSSTPPKYQVRYVTWKK